MEFHFFRNGKGKRIGPSKSKRYSITSELVINIVSDFFSYNFSLFLPLSKTVLFSEYTRSREDRYFFRPPLKLEVLQRIYVTFTVQPPRVHYR